MKMSWRIMGLVFAASLASSSCESKEPKRWVVVTVQPKYMIAVDMNSVEPSPTSVKLRSANLYDRPIQVDGRQMTHVVAEVEVSCPVATQLTSYEWRYDAEGLFQEGPTGEPEGPVPPNTVYAAIARRACENTLRDDRRGSFDTLEAATAYFHDWLAANPPAHGARD